MVFFKRNSNILSKCSEQMIMYSPDEAMLIAAACTPVDAERHPAVITYFNDRSIQSQLDWLEGLLPGCFAGRISETYIAPIANHDFRIFVVCGNDPKRMIKLLRHYRHLVGRKLCVAMMLRSTPGDRARLLSAGFDEVFDLRTQHIEANCRLNAHIRRQELTAHQAVLNHLPGIGHDSSVVIDLLAEQPLSERERLVLGRLHQRLGQLTPVAEIHRAIRRQYGHSHTRSLHVVISLLRKKLRKDLTITYRSEGGYILTITKLGADGLADASPAAASLVPIAEWDASEREDAAAKNVGLDPAVVARRPATASACR